MQQSTDLLKHRMAAMVGFDHTLSKKAILNGINAIA